MLPLTAILRLALIVATLLRMQMPVGGGAGNQVMVTTNQLLNPAGQRISFSGRPVDLALSPRGNLLAVLVPGSNAAVVQVYDATGARLRSLTLPGGVPSFLGLAFTPDGTQVAATLQTSTGTALSIASVDGSGDVRSLGLPNGSLPAGVVFDPAGQTAYVALNKTNQVAQLALAEGTFTTVPVGVAPLGVAVGAGRLFVTNWGGRRPGSADPSARSSGTATLVDSRGIASSGTVSVISLASFKVIAEIPVGLHPSGIAISPDGRLAAVANANSDTVSILDTATLDVVGALAVPAYPEGYAGSSPTAVAFNSSGERLYVACGGNNAVAVFERSGAWFTLSGFVPTDWYPVAVAALSAGGGDTLYVANAKGIGSRDSAGPRYTVFQQRGSVNAAPAVPDSAAVAAANQPFSGALAPEGSPEDLGRLGIRYVFLIIKENRTYDQVLGDLGQGNGNPALALYGADITPNHHRLAQEFVTLDNFYATGVVSADGHNWLTQAFASDYLERSSSAGWPRSYPYSGDDPLAFASTGFLWNNARDHGRSARIYGEFAFTSSGANHTWNEFLDDAEAPQRSFSVAARAQVAELNLAGILEPSYPGFTLGIPDLWRARLFIEQLAQGPPANLTIIQLPTDHTSGTAPGQPTPNAMMADNDLALARIVEAISNSPYWAESAILVTEDDAQAGVDHVDGHRTVCFAVSPWVRRGVVDSTHYNHLSVVRTVEELLGLPPMNKFDAAALPMRSVFTTTPDFAPFAAAQNRISLRALNAPLPALTGAARRAARDSMAMNFSVPDAAPEQKLNRILWHWSKGWSTPYPRVPHQPTCVMDEDDR